MCSRNGELTLAGLSLSPGLCPQAVTECEGSHLPSTKGKGPRARSRDTSRQNDHHEPSTGPFDSNTRAEEQHSAAGKPHSRQSGSPLGQSVTGAVPGSACTRWTDAGRRCVCPRPGLVRGPLHFCGRSCPLPHGLSSAPGLAHSPLLGFQVTTWLPSEACYQT